MFAYFSNPSLNPTLENDIRSHNNLALKVCTF